MRAHNNKNKLKRATRALAVLALLAGAAALGWLWYVTPTVSRVVACVESAESMAMVEICQSKHEGQLSISPGLSDAAMRDLLRGNTAQIVWLTRSREVPLDGPVIVIDVFKSLWHRISGGDIDDVTRVIVFGNAQNEVIGYYVAN